MDPYLRAEQLYQDIVNARTLMMQRQSTMSRTLFPLCIKNRIGRTFQLDLALLSCVYNFNCPAAQTILQADGGARLFYITDTKWLIVLPINHILCRVPLMKAYLAGSGSPTIPSEFSRFKQLYFKHGHADRSGVQGGGSPLFMLKVHFPCSNARPVGKERAKQPV